MNVTQKFPVRFFVVTFLWSWCIWMPLVLAGKGCINIRPEILGTITVPVSMLAAFGPAAGAFFSLRTIEGKGAVVRYLKRFLDIRFGWKTWLIPAGIFLVTTFAAWITPEFFGCNRLSMLLPNIYIFPLYWLIMVFLGGGQEEIGWRGYILEHLETKFGTQTGSMLLSIIWAVWHIPLFLISGTSQNYMNFIGFMMLTFGYSFIFSWALRKSDNRPLAGMMVHGTANSFIPIFPILSMTAGAAQPRFWLWVSMTFAAGLIFMEISRREAINTISGK
jgi:uncharacterized protein